MNTVHAVQNDGLRLVRSDVLLGFQLGHPDNSVAFHGHLHLGSRQVEMTLGRKAAFRAVDGVVQVMAGFDDGDAAQHGSGFRRVQADGDFLHVIRLGEFRVRSQDAALLFRLLPARAVPAVRIHAGGEGHADGRILHLPLARHQVNAAERDGQQEGKGENLERFNVHGGGNA